MNRKERRAAQKQGKGVSGAPVMAPPPAPPGRDLFAHAVQQLRAGQPAEAERLCHEALLLDPQFFEALHLAGFIALQSGRVAQAIDALRRAAALNPNSVDCAFHLALALHRAGRVEEAAAQFARAITLKPDFTAAHMNLGNVLMQLGKVEAAKAAYERVLALDAGSADAHINLGNVHMRLDQKAEAETHYRRAAALKPDHAGAQLNLGAALSAQGRIADAADAFQRAAALKPDAADAQRYLADALTRLGDSYGAETAYRRALGLQPDAVPARQGLANLMLDQGEFAAAIEEYGRILAARPDDAEVHSNLGVALAGLGQFADAEARYRHALALRPDLPDIYRNLGRLVLARGDTEEALALATRALAVGETTETKAFFVECAKECAKSRLGAPVDADFATMVARALTEGWSRPAELSALAADLFARSEAGGACLERSSAAWPRRLPAAELFGADALAAVSQDRLLRALLETAPVRTLGLERFLTNARSALLDAALANDTLGSDTATLEFFGALARQCFINEYVFAREDDEWQRAQELRDRLDAALAAGDPVPRLWLVAVAAYVPLHSLAQSKALLQRDWPDPLARLLVQQVREPLDERAIRESIAPLTTIEDDVSLAVRRQYEEMPYPRWVTAAPAGKPINVNWYLRNRFPRAAIRSLGRRDPLEVLVAGCGTGQHSIETAQRFAGARVLAVDLSLASLAYAARKSRALGLANVEYRQADILKLGGIGRSFDVIEASGVLHHLRDPAEGWRTLLSLLRSGGLMNVGLYSTLARADVRAAREFIAERGYGQTADDIRTSRQEMMAQPEGTPLRNLAKFPDFFTTSECRDLLFHVQEHQLTIPQIKAFLAENALTFIGFGVDADQRYRERFPHDHAMTDLDSWHDFEIENPTTFAGMYQFWVQKA